MKTTFTAYRAAVTDKNGATLNMAGFPIQEAGGMQLLTAAGTLGTALPDETAFIRVATDTAIHLSVEGAGAATTDPLLPANTVEYFAADEGMTPSIILA
jgi:hypothetical protein